MKAILILLPLLFIPVLLFSESAVSLHGGGSTYCDEDGCFGPTGVAYGATFTRTIRERWSFNIEATLACTWEDLQERVDPETGILFIPERERTRFWTGVAFVRHLNEPEARSQFYAGAGVVAGHEWQKTVAKSGDFYGQKSESGWKAGIALVGGYQYHLTQKWRVGPEARFYLLPDSLSAIRYSAVITRSF